MTSRRLITGFRWFLTAMLLGLVLDGSQEQSCQAADTAVSTPHSAVPVPASSPWSLRLTWGELFCASLNLCVLAAVGRYFERRHHRKQTEQQNTRHVASQVSRGIQIPVADIAALTRSAVESRSLTVANSR